jgi:hypothetical protein
LLLPLVLIIRIFYTAFCLFVGSLFQEYRWKWKQLFTISLKADIVFLLAAAVGFYYYVFVNRTETLDDMSTNFVSLLAVVERANTSAWLVSAYNAINLFELLYIAILAIFIHEIFSFKWWKSIIFVVLSYGIGLYLYIAGITFIYLHLSEI